MTVTIDISWFTGLSSDTKTLIVVGLWYWISALVIRLLFTREQIKRKELCVVWAAGPIVLPIVGILSLINILTFGFIGWPWRW